MSATVHQIFGMTPEMEPSPWETLTISKAPAEIEAKYAFPVALRSSDVRPGVEIVRESRSLPELQPFEVAQHIAQSAAEVGGEIRVLSMVPGRRGSKLQGFEFPTIRKPDPISWDSEIFSPDAPYAGDRVSTFIVGLTYRKGITRLDAGWLRLFCSNQLYHPILNLMPVLRISRSSTDIETLDQWLRAATAAALHLATSDHGSDQDVLPTSALRFVAAQMSLSDEERHPVAQGLIGDVETRLGRFGNNFLARQFETMSMVSQPIRPLDLLNAITNLERPHANLLTADGESDSPHSLVSPNVVRRHQDEVFTILMRLLFLGAKVTKTKRPAVLEGYAV